MIAIRTRRLLPLIALSILTSACSVLDGIEFGSGRQTWDPTKVYLKDEFVTLDKRNDMDRYVCLSGPLQCEGFGQVWDCSCF